MACSSFFCCWFLMASMCFFLWTQWINVSPFLLKFEFDWVDSMDGWIESYRWPSSWPLEEVSPDSWGRSSFRKLPKVLTLYSIVSPKSELWLDYNPQSIFHLHRYLRMLQGKRSSLLQPQESARNNHNGNTEKKNTAAVLESKWYIKRMYWCSVITVAWMKRRFFFNIYLFLFVV